ncbi:hypothetical protein ACS5PN_03165 [Roseateles sp. NT4]|uniref:hypothetical protein n=1 Tax=Roseateles sp. NT4 TaxID=3453715 RepID=UPI003EEEF63F
MNKRDQRALEFIAAYVKGETVEAGWLYAKALQQSRLDFSDASLDRIDHLLASVRGRAKPSADTLRNTEQGRNFCALIAYYLGEFIHRRTGATLNWHDRESATAVLPPGPALPDAPHMRLVAVVPEQAQVLMLLGWIEACALETRTQSTASALVARFCEVLTQNGPALWKAGLYAVGRMAAWQMTMAYDDGVVVPSMMSSTRPDIWVTLGMGEGIDEYLAMGARKLEDNPEGAAWQVLSYDGHGEFQGQRRDAIMVVLQTYEPAPLKLKIAFPYRQAADGREFTILTPTLLTASTDRDAILNLSAAIDKGTQAVRWPGGLSWNQFLEDAETPPSSRHHLPPQPAQLEMAQIMEKLRASFEQRQQRMSDLTLASVLATPPDWMRPDDSLKEVFARQKLLLTEGRVVWGALVQANNLMFEPGNANCPGLLVYSPDEHFDAHPMELRLVGRAFFGLKGTQPDDPELARLAKLVTEEADRTLQFRLPRVFCSQDVCSGIFMLFRKHIPNGVLSCGLFPVLTHPSTPAVLMLPFEFWPIELIVMWKEGRL